MKEAAQEGEALTGPIAQEWVQQGLQEGEQRRQTNDGHSITCYAPTVSLGTGRLCLPDQRLRARVLGVACQKGGATCARWDTGYHRIRK